VGRTAWVAGATGLIGKELVQLLLADKAYSKVIILVRKKVNIAHPKLEQRIIDFNRIEESVAGELKDAYVFCTLGTTIRIAKTKDAFRKVDYEYPFRLAQISASEGAKQFSIVTSIGASTKSSFFYTQVKGQVEEAIRKLGLQALHIYRPSQLLGDREEVRRGERMAEIVAKATAFLWKGPLAKYKPIHVRTVARAMLEASRMHEKGIHVHESFQLPDLAASYMSVLDSK
jgi:uncharacterized protein YbjT (DUF2867 family)